MNGLLAQGQVQKPSNGLFAWADMNQGRKKPSTPAAPSAPKPPVITGPSVPVNGGVPVYGSDGGGDGPAASTGTGSGGISPSTVGQAANIGGLVGLATGNQALSQASAIAGLGAGMASAPSNAAALGMAGAAAASMAGVPSGVVGAAVGAAQSGLPGAIAGAVTGTIASMSPHAALAMGIVGLVTGKSVFSMAKGAATPVSVADVTGMGVNNSAPGPGAISSVDAGISGMGVNNADSTVSNDATTAVQSSEAVGAVSTNNGIADTATTADTGMAVNSSGQAVSNSGTIGIQDNAVFGVVSSGADGIADATSGVAGSTAATSAAPDGPDGNNGPAGDDATSGVAGSTAATADSPDGPDGSNASASDGGGGGGGGGDCFVAGTLVLMEGGELRPIEQVKIGERVVSAGRETSNEVKFIEFLPATHWDRLYSPAQGMKPFATFNHPLIFNGTYVAPEPEKTRDMYPWLGEVKQVPLIEVVPSDDQRVYNLWLDGDGTYTVNGFGTTSIIGDGGWLRKGVERGLFTPDTAMTLIQENTVAGPAYSYGSYCLNKWIGALDWGWLNKATAALVTKPMLRPLADALTGSVGTVALWASRARQAKWQPKGVAREL